MEKIHTLIKQAQNGDNNAFEIIINENIGLVWSIVKKFINRGIDKDDLFQLGSMGLVKAVKKFNFDYDVKFSTYAVPMIIGEIKRYIRDDGLIKVSRSLKEVAYKAIKSKEILTSKFNREPNIDEIANYIEVDKEILTVALNSVRDVDSIDRKITNEKGNELNVVDTIVFENDKSEKIVNNILLNETINKLAQREQNIVKMRYINEMTQTEVANIIGVSQVQISRLEKKILKKMKDLMCS